MHVLNEFVLIKVISRLPVALAYCARIVDKHRQAMLLKPGGHRFQNELFGVVKLEGRQRRQINN